MEKVKAVISYLAAPLEFVARVIAKFPKGALILWAISLVITALLF